MMTKVLLLAGLVLAATACTPQYPSAAEHEGLCQSGDCTIDGKPAEVYYQSFMSGVHGSCSDQPSMKFTYMEAQSVLPNTADGFAVIRLYLNPNRTYHGAYVDPLGQFGMQNPSHAVRKVTHIEGRWYLSGDKIVIEGIGIGHKISDQEILVQPISSTKLPLQHPMQISFIAKQAIKSEKGETVQAYCAAQADSSAK